MYIYTVCLMCCVVCPGIELQLQLDTEREEKTLLVKKLEEVQVKTASYCIMSLYD